MARIQILELPNREVADGRYETPFVVIIDKIEHDSIDSASGPVRTVFQELFEPESIKAATGAAGVIISTDTLDVN